MPTNNTKIYLTPFANARESLRNVIENLKHGDSLAPITVLVPTNYSGISLRQDLGHDGLLNIRFEEVGDFIELIAGAKVSAKGSPRLTSIVDSAAIQSALSQASGSLDRIQGNLDSHRSIHSTFQELRRAKPEALSKLEQGGEISSQVIKLFKKYRSLVSNYKDDQDLLDEVISLIQGGDTQNLREAGSIVFFLVQGINNNEQNFIEAIYKKAGGSAIFGLTGNDDIDGTVISFARYLNISCPIPKKGDPDNSNATVSLGILPDAHEEIRWTIRSVTKFIGNGIPLHRIAILYRQLEPYGSLVWQELSLAGIPYVGPSSTRLSETPAGKTLLGIVNLADCEMDRSKVMEWVTNSPIKLHSKTNSSFSGTQWDSISRKANIVQGFEDWQSKLKIYADEIESQAMRSLELDEIDEARAKRIKTEATATRSLLEFTSTLYQRLKVPSASSWTEFADWARTLLDIYMDSYDVSQKEISDKIFDVLREIGTLDRIEQPPSLDLFRVVLENALSNPIGHLGKVGEGIFVGSLNSAYGMEFDVLHVVGMIEGLMPPRLFEDPLIPDMKREKAGGPEVGLNLSSGRQKIERRVYLSALESAPIRILSFPRTDLIGQRGLYPSPWFLDSATDLEGSRVNTNNLYKLGPRSWMTIMASTEEVLQHIDKTGSYADLLDIDMNHYWKWKKAGHLITDHPLALQTGLGRTMLMEWDRQTGRLSEWDGDISEVSSGSRSSMLISKTISPTSLQSWAQCPFQYYLGKVLGISAIDDPSQSLTITSRVKGSLIHGILEQFIATSQRNGTIPSPGEIWGSSAKDLLFSIASTEFANLETKGLTGKTIMWELEKEAIISDLATFLTEDTRLRQRFGTSPLYVETRFGMHKPGKTSWPPAEYSIPEIGTLQFRGIIDRIDVDPRNKKALIIDYKTGKYNAYKTLENDPLGHGEHLQLPVYALALRRVLGFEIQLRIAYWFISNKGKFRVIPANPPTDEEVSESFAKTLSTIASGIQTGIFPANPGPRQSNNNTWTNCRYCDFDSLCSSRRDILWNRKKESDPRIKSYANLSLGKIP